MGSERGQDRRFCDRRATIPYHQDVSSSRVDGCVNSEHVQRIATKSGTQERRLFACL